MMIVLDFSYKIYYFSNNYFRFDKKILLLLKISLANITIKKRKQKIYYFYFFLVKLSVRFQTSDIYCNTSGKRARHNSLSILVEQFCGSVKKLKKRNPLFESPNLKFRHFVNFSFCPMIGLTYVPNLRFIPGLQQC